MSSPETPNSNSNPVAGTPQKPQIMTMFGPLSKIEKELQMLKAQMALEIQKQKEKQERKFLREKIRVSKLKPYVMKSVDYDEDEIPIDGDIIRGSRLYTRDCLSCHQMDANSYYRNNTGPALGMIYQRRNAADLHFTGYSDSLLKSDFMWTANKLNIYLRNPKELVPGTKCNFINGGVSSQEDRVDIITFMREYTKAMSVNLRTKLEKKLSKTVMESKDQVDKVNQDKYTGKSV